MYALHTDHLRSTRLVTSEATAQGIVSVVESTDYDAFGKIVSYVQSPISNFTERKNNFFNLTKRNKGNTIEIYEEQYDYN